MSESSAGLTRHRPMPINIQSPLIDPHGRRVRKLRISLTDKCNLRCHYCMPLDATFMDERQYLGAEEYASIIEELVGLGLEEVRMTGGEPLMRKSFGDIAAGLSGLGLKKIGLTTNGVLLDRHLDVMKQYGVHHLNISLDSLNEDTFRKITHGNHLARVLRNIESARRSNFNVKINVVAMRGVNDHEVLDFAEMARTLDVEVRFLEFMRIGYARHTQTDQFISARELMTRLESRYTLTRATVPADSTSFNFTLNNGARLGFIASESQPFCGQCSRWRLSADGILRACLFKDDGHSIRNQPAPVRALIYQALLGMKPTTRPVEVLHQMNTIGG